MEFHLTSTTLGVCFLLGLTHGFAPKASFRSLFSRMPQLQLSSFPVKIITNFTDIEQCANECVTQTDFDCRSFDVDNFRRACLLHNTTHEDYRTVLQNSMEIDHYRSAFDKLFNRLPNHVLTLKHNRLIEGLSVGECARRCVFEQNFRCAGFDYEPEYANCWLTDMTLADSKFGVKKQFGADYYERDFGGALSNFISYGSGSLPFEDARMVYSKTLYGVDLAACAHLCLSQIMFDCGSFDYTFVDQLCQMSEYFASTLGGIDTKKMPTNRVVHFEKKGLSLERFSAMPFSGVVAKDGKRLEMVTPEMCAKTCLEETEFVCRSFDFQTESNTCILSPKIGSDVGKMINAGLEKAHRFELKPSLDCGGALTDVEGDFASPGWPRNYSHYLNCTWTVQVPKHKVIFVNFLHFDLGTASQNPCSLDHDRLLLEEKTVQGDLRFCASPPMTTYVSQTNKVTFNFRSDGSQDALGFKVNYKSDWPCRAVLRENYGEVATPQWPNVFPNGLTCAWSIQAPPNGNIRLQFDSVDLDRGREITDCTDPYHSVTVYDGSNSNATKLATFCKDETPASIVSSGSVLFITFKSGKNEHSTGFHAKYEFILPTTTPPPTATPTSTSEKYDSSVVEEVHDEYSLEDIDVLTANFVEQGRKRESRKLNDTVGIGLSIGGEHPNLVEFSMETESENDDISINIYMTILMSALLSLFLLALTLVLVLIVVCRNRKKNLTKRQCADPYVSKEEGKPLCLSQKSFDENYTNYVHECEYDPDNKPNPLLAMYYHWKKSNPLAARSEVTLVSECSGYSSAATGSARSSLSQGSTHPLVGSCKGLRKIVEC